MLLLSVTVNEASMHYILETCKSHFEYRFVDAPILSTSSGRPSDFDDDVLL